MSMEMVRLIWAVVDQMIKKDQFGMPHGIFQYVYLLYHLIDRIFYVENNPVLVHVEIWNN
jgi:hypothetical protein